MGAIPLESTEARRPSWPQTLGAVIGGSVLAWALTLAWMFPLGWLVPLGGWDDSTGQGWPWRIDGPWALAADLGPLLLCGLAFSFGFQAFLGHFREPVRRPSFLLTLVAAVLGYVTVAPPTNPGLIAVDGVLALVIVALVAREEALRERMRITRRGVVLTVVAGVVLTGATMSYGATHGLTVAADPSPGGTKVHLHLDNEGRLDVRIRSVTIPDRHVVAVTREDERTPIAGARIPGHEHFFSAQLVLARPRCGLVLDRLRIHYTVAGRDLRETVRLRAPVELTCP